METRRSKIRSRSQDCTRSLTTVSRCTCLPLLVATIAIIGALPAVSGGSETASTRRIAALKAGYLLNFARFAEWSPGDFADPDAPLVIGIVGDDPFGRILDDAVADKIVDGRSVVVRRVKAERGATVPSKSDLTACHVLFVSASMRSELDLVIEVTKDSRVLTVSDIQGFARLGGIIEFEPRAERIGFKINPDAAEQCGITLSSRLLALATLVGGEAS